MSATHSPKTVIVTRVPERSPVVRNIDGSYSNAAPPAHMAIRTVCRACGQRLA